MSRWSRQHPSLTRPSGFSLVELIIIIIILGILSAAALPRFFRPADFEARFVVDDLKLALQYAQKRAVNGGCQTEFRLTATGFSLWSDSACDGTPASFLTAVNHPSDGGPFAVTFPSGVTLNAPAPPLTLRFTTFGTITNSADALIAAPLTLQIQQADVVRNIIVHGSTGVIE